jgi:hypothetical protein
MSRLLLLTLFAGCSASAAAPTAAVTAPAKAKATAATPDPSFAAAAARAGVSGYSAGVPTPLPPGATPRGWIVVVNSTVTNLNGTYTVYRNARTSDAAPGGETPMNGNFCAVQCDPGGSRVVMSQLNTPGFTGPSAGFIGYGGPGVSFSASGNVLINGVASGTYTANVTVVP